MIIIEKERNLETIIPMSMIESDTDIQALVNKGLILGLENDNGVDDEGNMVKITYLNFISNEDFRFLKNKGVEVNWLKSKNLPYCKVEGKSLPTLPYVDEFAYPTIDGAVLYRIYSNIVETNGVVNMTPPDNATIQAWVDEYGVDSIYTDPIEVNNIIVDDE